MLLRSGKSYSYKPMLKRTKKTKVTKNVKKYVKKAIDRKQELKQYLDAGDITSTSNLTLATWSNAQCFSLPNGAGDDERIGDKVRISSIYIAGSVYFKPTTDTFASLASQNQRQVRVVVAQLKRGYTIAELVAQMPTDSITAPLSADDITRRCYILADRKYDEIPFYSSSTTNILSVGQTKHFTFNLKPKITQALWDSGTSGDAPPDIQGALYILYLFVSPATNSTVAVQDAPDVRINYRDA